MMVTGSIKMFLKTEVSFDEILLIDKTDQTQRDVNVVSYLLGVSNSP